MSESGESVDHEVEVRMPELVSFEDGGQGDIYHDCQKLNNEEVLVESASYSQRGNEDNHVPPLSALSGFLRRTEMQQFPSLTQPLNFMMKPESYDGTVSWEEYISHFNDCAELSRWTDRQKVLFLAASLRGQARTFYMSLSLAERRSFDSLINKFSQRFGNSRHQNKWLSKLESRRRQTGESAAALGDDIRQMVQKAYCDLDEKAQEILALNHLYKLISVEMKCRCIDKNCQSISEAADVIDRFEAILGENYDKKKHQARAMKTNDVDFNIPQDVPTSVKLMSNTASAFDSSALLQEISARLERLERANKKPSHQLCFHCNSPKHFIKDCPLLERPRPGQRRNQDVSRRQNYQQGNGRPSAL